nr:hypothetical protein KXZ65_21960 [Pectobacterium sp. PL152]
MVKPLTEGTERMRQIDYHGTTICVLDDNDMLTDCPIGSYAVIEDSGHYVAVRVGETDAPAIHIDPEPTVTTFVPALALLMGFPSSIAVLLTVTRSVCCCSCAAVLTTCASILAGMGRPKEKPQQMLGLCEIDIKIKR